MRVLSFVVALMLLIPNNGFAQTMTDFAGMVPKGDARPAATDLEHYGRILTPEEVLNYKKQGYDVAAVDPNESDIWAKAIQNVPQAELGLRSSGETFTFVSNLIGVIGNHRIVVSKIENGVARNYTILFSAKSHAALMRKALLRKLGYRVPGMQRLSNFNLRFKGSFSRKGFLEALQKGTMEPKATEMWVVGTPTEDAAELTLQDAIVIDNESQIYNLALGNVPGEVVLGRRVMNALLVPFHLVDVPESVNFFNWNSARTVNDAVYLPYDAADGLMPSFDDATWISRKILNLSRRDLEDVVAAAEYPPEVAALAVEKVVSRRNGLAKVMGINAPELPFNPEISLGADLTSGKLKHKDKWPGYASRFTFGDPSTPLSGAQLRALFKSRLISGAVDNLTARFNSDIIPQTSVAKALYEKQVDLAKKQFADFLKTGKVKKIPFGVTAVPVIGGDLIASRDVITGQYMGLDNPVQLADSFGYSMDAGVFLGAHGLPTSISLSAQAKVFLSRVYSHIRPIKDIRAATKTPLKNLIVPLLSKKLINSLDPISVLESIETNEDGTPKLSDKHIAEIKKALEALKKEFGVGDSLMIQDSIGGSLGAGLGAKLAENISLQATLSDSQVVIRRLHIFRKDEDTFQIYSTPGEYNFLQLSVGLKAFIPIIEITASRKAGQADTSFFELVFHDNDPATNLANARALQHLFTTNKTAGLEATKKPFVIKHRFKEVASGGKFFHARWLNQKTTDFIEANHPEGGKKQFVYAAQSKVEGVNYEALTVDLINFAVSELVDDDIFLDSPQNPNPGTTLAGKSTSRRASFEAEIDPDMSKPAFKEAFAEVTYNWRGWSISRKDALKIIDDISKKFEFPFYPDGVLNNTKKLQLYSLDVTINIYQSGIDNLTRVTEKQLQDALEAEGKWFHPFDIEFCGGGGCTGPTREQIREKAERIMRQFKVAKSSYAKNILKRDYTGAAKAAMSMVTAVEIILSPKKFIEFLGGPQHVFVNSRITGFRADDEAAENAIVSSSLGQIGSKKPMGPLRWVQNKIGMTEGEFFIYWLLNRP